MQCNVCMYVCMYVSLPFPFAPQYFPQKNTVFPAFSQRGRPKTLSFSRFRQKDAGSPSQQKSRQGESSLGPLFCDTGSPKTTFSGASSNCRAVRGGPPPPSPPPPHPKTYVIDVGRGGVSLYPLVSIRHAEQCRRITVKRLFIHSSLYLDRQYSDKKTINFLRSLLAMNMILLVKIDSVGFDKY